MGFGDFTHFWDSPILLHTPKRETPVGKLPPGGLMRPPGRKSWHASAQLLTGKHGEKRFLAVCLVFVSLTTQCPFPQWFQLSPQLKKACRIRQA